MQRHHTGVNGPTGQIRAGCAQIVGPLRIDGRFRSHILDRFSLSDNVQFRAAGGTLRPDTYRTGTGEGAAMTRTGRGRTAARLRGGLA